MRPFLLVLSCTVLVSAAHAAPVPRAEREVRARFDRFVAAQNAHDADALAPLLSASPGFLWITRGTAVWGRDAALERFRTLYAGTWRLAPDTAAVRVIVDAPDAARVFAPVDFTIGAAGAEPTRTTFLLNQSWVRERGTWRLVSLLPVPLPPPAPR